MMRLLALEREGQTVAVQAQPGLVQTALEQTGVALQGIQGVGPLRRDHGADLIVAMELEAHLDATERGGLELDDQAIDPAGHRLGDLHADLEHGRGRHLPAVRQRARRIG